MSRSRTREYGDLDEEQTQGLAPAARDTVLGDRCLSEERPERSQAEASQCSTQMATGQPRPTTRPAEERTRRGAPHHPQDLREAATGANTPEHSWLRGDRIRNIRCVDCPAGQVCKSGQCCVDECTEAGERECSADFKGFKTCGNFDQDACLEWTESTCDEGSSCVNGACPSSSR